MISIFQRFSALFLTLIILSVATIIFAISLALRSNIHDGLVVDSRDVVDSCRIYRNAFGIPHIICSNESDAYFSLGFAHAQDRLWQMDLLRRIARGKTARIFGEKTLPADKFFRVLGISAIADRLSSSISRQSRTALEAYTHGVNTFIEQNRNNLPFEFDALHYEPETWRVSDCLAIERLMAFDMSMSFWTDLAIGEIADTLGVNEALKFIPSYPATSPTVCDYTRSNGRSDTSQHSHTSSAVGGQLMRDMAQNLGLVREALGMTAMCSGSNCWVMSKHEGNSKGLIFANDPHLGLVLPPRWYQVHMTCPQYNVVGCTIPGVPGIVSGRNDHIAWGITNVMLDDCDYFIEKVDPANTAYYYKSDGARVRFKHIRDTVEVKRGKNVDSVFIDYRATATSPVLSDVHVARERDSLFHYPAGASSVASKYVLSFAWTAREESDEILTSLRLLRCSSWKEFCEALSSWGAPALNFTYADDKGNMGIAPSGVVARRGSGDPNFPHPAWEAAYAWHGFYSASTLPRVYNPPRRYVMSANNLTTRSAPYYLSSLWEPPSRAERIDEMLQEYREYTVRDAQFMQLDHISRNARQVLHETIALLIRDTSSLTPLEYTALSSLTHWDYAMSPLDAAPAVYTAFHERLLHATFTRKISHELYLKYAYVGSLPMRKLNEILADSTNAWFADSPESGLRQREQTILQSFKDAVTLLQNSQGSDFGQWSYGKLHRLVLKHPFHDVTAFRSIVSHDVKNVGGDATTLNNSLWQVHNPFDVYIGASMRLVTDMEDSIVYSVVPGGSSGQPLDAHYADQIQLWANGGYIPISMARHPGSAFSLYSVIVPQAAKAH